MFLLKNSNLNIRINKHIKILKIKYPLSSPLLSKLDESRSFGDWTKGFTVFIKEAYNKFNTDDWRNKFERYVLVQSIIITLLGIPIMFIIRNQPPSPPSSSAEKVLRSKSKGQCNAIGKLTKNRDYIFLMLSFFFHLFDLYYVRFMCGANVFWIWV